MKLVEKKLYALSLALLIVVWLMPMTFANAAVVNCSGTVGETTVDYPSDANGNCNKTGVVGAQPVPSATTPTVAPTSPGVATGKVGGANLTYTPLEPIPGVNNNNPNFPQYISGMYQLFVVIGCLLAVLLLVVGGIQYMLSESFDIKDKAKKRIQNALWGLIILLGSYLILYTLNPGLLTFSLNPTIAPVQSVQNVSQPSPNVCGSGTACVTGSGTVPTIETSDANAAITANQNQPPTVQSQSTLQAANQDLQIDQAYCASNLNGTVGPPETSTGCTGDIPEHYLGGGVYNSCANIPTPSGGVQSCYYNK